MATKSKKLCQGKDVFERMNFLYQASTLLAAKNPVLAQHYGNQCKIISRKSLQGMEPDMKRSLCKRCGTVLVPGLSSEIDIKSEANNTRKVFEIECSNCSFVKRFVLNPNYNLWIDQPEAIKEVIQPGIDK